MKQEIISIENNANIKVGKTSRQRLPWYLRVLSRVEKWWLESVIGINPDAERLVRIYTYNDEDGVDYDYKVPNFTYDLVSGLYDDFLTVTDEIGLDIFNLYGIGGRYFYDVLITVCYDQFNTSDFNVEKRFTYGYKIIRTDNPRCSLGNPKYRKDCTYTANYDSHITIEGYKLSGKYYTLAQVLNDLATKTVLVHSKSDAKALLRILKFLGVRHAYVGNKYKYNNPNKINFFSRNVYGYQLFQKDGCIYVDILSRTRISTDVFEVIDIDELIVGRSLKSRLGV